MVDRIEREIEEILAKLDDGPSPPAADGRTPTSIKDYKRKSPSKSTSSSSKSAPRSSPRRSFASLLPDINPATLLFTGAGLLVAGLILTLFMPALIWVSFAGIIVFLSAFAWSFVRTPRTPAGGGGGRQAATGHYWRDRYISYEPQGKGNGPLDKIRRRFRR